MKVEEKLIEKGFKIWERKDSEGKVIAKRVYINNLEDLAKRTDKSWSKSLRRCQMVYDCLNDTFSYDVSSSRVYMVEELISDLRK